MSKRLLPPDGLIVAVLAGPAVAVAAAAVAWGALPWGWGVAVSLAGVVAVWLALRHWLFDIRELGDYVRRLAARSEPPIPALKTGFGREMVTAIAGMHDALTAESRGHAALAASGQASLDSLPDPLLLVDGEGTIVAGNTAARSLLGRDPVGLDLAGVLRIPPVLDAVDRVLGGVGIEQVEFVMPYPADQTYVARVNGLSVPGVGGARLVLSLHDVSAVRRSERMRAEFVANASHELRTPLASLQGFIETLAGPARDDAAAREQFLPIMHQMATRMGRLIEDLLSLSRIEFDEHTPPKDPVDLKAVVLSVGEGVAPQAAQRQMSLDVRAPADLPLARGQADQLTQVLQNLIDNAIKYGRAGSPVEITLSHERTRAGAMVAVAVRDFGEGIAREHLPRLTERFFRCDTARSRELGGTGLGLAIVKHIVNRHRGTLLIDSVPGQGSVFTIHIPTFAE